jgi:Uma2 family endonuclease
MNVIDRERRFRVPDLPPPPAPVEQAAFLRWVQRQEGRYELVKGRVVMMTGVSRNHAKVALRIAALLYASLDRTLFQVSSADFGVQTPAGIRYPDVMVDPAGRDGSELTTDAPIFIAEVLSPSSIAIDMVEKAAEYRQIESLTAYAVFAQDEPRVWAWIKGENGWPGNPTMIEGPDAALEIPALRASVPLRAIY